MPVARGSVVEAARWLAAARTPRVSLGDLLDGMGERGQGFLLLVLTLPNILFIPSIPLLPLVFGGPAMLVCVRMMLGRHATGLPGWLRRRSLNRERAVRLTRVLLWMSGWTKPRMLSLATGRALRVVAPLGLLFTMVLCLPLPGLNAGAGAGVLLLALGLAEADGLLVLLGILLGLLGCVICMVGAAQLAVLAGI